MYVPAANIAEAIAEALADLLRMQDKGLAHQGAGRGHRTNHHGCTISSMLLYQTFRIGVDWKSSRMVSGR